MKFPEVASKFAEAVIERDYAQAFALTTKGLRTRMNLEEFVEAIETAEKEVVPPGTFGLSSNSMTFEELAKQFDEMGKPLPQDIKPESFRLWMCIEFIPDPDDPTELDACYDVWCMVVNENGADQIAYFEIKEPDLDPEDESL
jgi:hypothetical protein